MLKNQISPTNLCPLVSSHLPSDISLLPCTQAPAAEATTATSTRGQAFSPSLDIRWLVEFRVRGKGPLGRLLSPPLSTRPGAVRATPAGMHTALVIPKYFPGGYHHTLPAAQEVRRKRTFYTHFTDEDTEAHRDSETFLGEQSPGLSAPRTTISGETPGHNLSV